MCGAGDRHSLWGHTQREDRIAPFRLPQRLQERPERLDARVLLCHPPGDFAEDHRGEIELGPVQKPAGHPLVEGPENPARRFVTADAQRADRLMPLSPCLPVPAASRQVADPARPVPRVRRLQSDRLTVMELEIFCLLGQPIEIVGQVVMSIGVLRIELDRETEHVDRTSVFVVPVRQGTPDLVQLFHELETPIGIQEVKVRSQQLVVQGFERVAELRISSWGVLAREAIMYGPPAAFRQPPWIVVLIAA